VITGVSKDDETEMLIDCLLNDKALPEETERSKGSVEEISGNILAFLKANPEMAKSM
jgi:hypothetical protein